jgi:hypothetical protein
VQQPRSRLLAIDALAVQTERRERVRRALYFVSFCNILGRTSGVYDGFVRVADKVKHGFGTFKWSTGQIYQVDSRCARRLFFPRIPLTVAQGEWRNDSQNGKGLWTFPSGQVYYGELRNGLYHGRGCIRFSNGNACFRPLSPAASSDRVCLFQIKGTTASGRTTSSTGKESTTGPTANITTASGGRVGFRVGERSCTRTA